MTSLPWFITEVAQRFADDHPFWSHLWNVPPKAYAARRVEFDRRTARRAALAKTSYPAVTQPPAAAGDPPTPTHLLSFPTSWDAVTHPVRTCQSYAKALPQRLALYVRDPVAGMTADFKDLRHHNRFADLVGRAAEDDVAQAPVMAAKLVDYLVAPPLFPPSFAGPGSKAPQPFPRPLKFAPLPERVMRPMLEDAALRPPTTRAEEAVDGLTRAATLLGKPSEAVIEAAPRVRAYFGELWEAGNDLRAGLLDGKTWDYSFGQLSRSAKSTLISFWDRAAAGRTGKLEEAAVWGEDAIGKRSALGKVEVDSLKSGHQADHPVVEFRDYPADPNVKLDVPEPSPIPKPNTTRRGSRRANPLAWRKFRDHLNESGYGEALSETNRDAIARGRTPSVDAAWVALFPEDAGLMGEQIRMHHIGGYPITTPLAETRHLNAHMPGGYRKNQGNAGSPLPFYPAKTTDELDQ